MVIRTLIVRKILGCFSSGMSRRLQSAAVIRLIWNKYITENRITINSSKTIPPLYNFGLKGNN